MANPEYLPWLLSLRKSLFLLLKLEMEGLIPVTTFMLVPFFLISIAIVAYLWLNCETLKVAFVMAHLPPTE